MTFPHRVLRVAHPFAEVEDRKKIRRVRIDGAGPVRAGEWLLVQADLGIRTVSAGEAKKILSYFREQ